MPISTSRGQQSEAGVTNATDRGRRARRLIVFRPLPIHKVLRPETLDPALQRFELPCRRSWGSPRTLQICPLWSLLIGQHSRDSQDTPNPLSGWSARRRARVWTVAIPSLSAVHQRSSKALVSVRNARGCRQPRPSAGGCVRGEDSW